MYDTSIIIISFWKVILNGRISLKREAPKVKYANESIFFNSSASIKSVFQTTESSRIFISFSKIFSRFTNPVLKVLYF